MKGLLLSVPKFLYVQPSLRTYVKNNYPKLRHFISDQYRKNETLVVVSDSNTDHVDEKGVLYVHPTMFEKVHESMFDFFNDCRTGSINNAASQLLKKLQGESYEHITR